MADLLKDRYLLNVACDLADRLAVVYPAFERDEFVAAVEPGYLELSLLARARAISQQLRRFLPADYPEALAILLASMGPTLNHCHSFGMQVFIYMPHNYFVADYGLSHPELSLDALYHITQRFTAEFGIRPFLAQHPELTIARLTLWAQDDNEHVRRWVSEGTRPRLPWACRVAHLLDNPEPTLVLLEMLKDDSSAYVRRSVANHLNDISKDHPQRVLALAQQWLLDANVERRKLIQHGLRSLLKQGHPQALALLGYGDSGGLEWSLSALLPSLRLGESLNLSLELTNCGESPLSVRLDVRCWYQKANAKLSPKVFRLKAFNLAAWEQCQLAKVISLAQMTTRKHYPGLHRVELLLNGQCYPWGEFELLPEKRASENE